MMRQFSHMRPQTVRLPPAVRAKLRGRDWLGNLRELSNTLFVAIGLAEGGVIDLPDLPPTSLAPLETTETLSKVVAACGGNMALAARGHGAQLT